jgi:hypothetical protein
MTFGGVRLASFPHTAQTSGPSGAYPPAPSAEPLAGRMRRKDLAPATAGESVHPPKWIKPQLTRLVDEAPAGVGLHEIKYDSYRMHARIDGGAAALLTRTGLNWSHRYRRTIESLGSFWRPRLVDVAGRRRRNTRSGQGLAEDHGRRELAGSAGSEEAETPQALRRSFDRRLATLLAGAD